MLVEYSMLEQVVSDKGELVVLLDHGGRSLAGLHAAVVDDEEVYDCVVVVGCLVRVLPLVVVDGIECWTDCHVVCLAVSHQLLKPAAEQEVVVCRHFLLWVEVVWLYEQCFLLGRRPLDRLLDDFPWSLLLLCESFRYPEYPYHLENL